MTRAEALDVMARAALAEAGLSDGYLPEAREGAEDFAADGTLSLMDASGEHIAAVWRRGRVLTISAHGLHIECFEERAAGRFIRRELWANTEEANGK